MTNGFCLGVGKGPGRGCWAPDRVRNETGEVAFPAGGGACVEQEGRLGAF